MLSDVFSQDLMDLQIIQTWFLKIRFGVGRVSCETVDRQAEQMGTPHAVGSSKKHTSGQDEIFQYQTNKCSTQIVFYKIKSIVLWELWQ